MRATRTIRGMVERNSSQIFFDEARMSSLESNASTPGDNTGTPNTIESLASSEVTQESTPPPKRQRTDQARYQLRESGQARSRSHDHESRRGRTSTRTSSRHAPIHVHVHIQQPSVSAVGAVQQGQPFPLGQGTTRTHHRKRLEKYHKMKKKEQKAQREKRDQEVAPQGAVAKAPAKMEETRLEGEKASSSRFVPAQLCTMSHHLEVAQHAAVQRGPETFTLLTLRSTYAAMEFQLPIPRGYEDRWLQTVAEGHWD